VISNSFWYFVSFANCRSTFLAFHLSCSLSFTFISFFTCFLLSIWEVFFSNPSWFFIDETTPLNNRRMTQWNPGRWSAVLCPWLFFSLRYCQNISGWSIFIAVALLTYLNNDLILFYKTSRIMQLIQFFWKQYEEKTSFSFLYLSFLFISLHFLYLREQSSLILRCYISFWG
jgi:hypothetical protein